MGSRALLLALCLGWSTQVMAQTAPRLAWDQPGPSLAEVSTWSWELWVGGIGQLPLLTATCTGTASPFICMSTTTVPQMLAIAKQESEGTKRIELKAVTPPGLRSATSAPFFVVVPAAPTNLRAVAP